MDLLTNKNGPKILMKLCPSLRIKNKICFSSWIREKLK